MRWYNSRVLQRRVQLSPGQKPPMRKKLKAWAEVSIPRASKSRYFAAQASAQRKALPSLQNAFDTLCMVLNEDKQVGAVQEHRGGGRMQFQMMMVKDREEQQRQRALDFAAERADALV